MGSSSGVYGTWLNEYPWDYFLTIAPRYEGVTSEACIRICRNFLNRHCGPGSYAFCPVERAGRNHIHALIGGTSITPESAIAVLSRHGRVQIDPYIRDGGAAFYTAKGIHTDFCAYEILGQWPDLN